MRIFRYLLAIVPMTIANAADELSLDHFDPPRFQAPKAKGTMTIVPGKVGNAARLQFDHGNQNVFFPSNIRGTPAWDRADGFSFWVKGDAKDGVGGLQMIFDDDYAVRYDFAFPVKGTEWTKVEVAWSDMIPVLPGPRAKPLGTPDGNPPSKITAVWIGKWWYWGDYPALSFTIDELQLEPTITRANNDFTPKGNPLERVAAKIRAGKPITIVTMGDSLTDKRHWANRPTCWVDLLKANLDARFKSEVTIVNPAIGGTQLRQNVVLIPKWLETTPSPDLVTIFFGGNDYDSGMRGPEFERACIDAIDRVRRATKGKADILLLTTNPTAAAWGRTDQLSDACRRAAKARNAGLADTRAAFETASGNDRNALFVDDRVHLSKRGHEVVAETIEGAILGPGKK